MSIFIMIRDVLIALALSWVGVSLETQTEMGAASQPAAGCASHGANCAAPQN